MIDVSIANTMANTTKTNVFVIDTSVFVAITKVFVIFTIVNITESIVKRIYLATQNWRLNP